MRTYSTTTKRVAATPRSKTLRNRIVTKLSVASPATASTDNRLGSLLNTLSNLLVPVDDAGNELSLLYATDAVALKAKVSLWTPGELSAKGNGGTSGGEGGSGEGIDEDALADLLVEWGYATQQWVEEQGYLKASALNSYMKSSDALATFQPKGNYLTDVTKPMIESVLTGNITSHTHSQYLTGHQSLANYMQFTVTEKYVNASFNNTALSQKAVDTYIECWDSPGWWHIKAGKFSISGGTSSQFLKADGSVDSNTYLTTGTAASTYLPLSGGTMTGALNVNLIGNQEGNVGLLGYKQLGQTNWFVGAIDTQGILRSNSTSLLHRRDGVDYTIWDAYNDGTGSGLDADLLDGLHAKDFMQSINAGANADVSNIDICGAYRIGASATNIPAGSDEYGNLLVIRGGSAVDTLAQLYFSYTANRTWLRSGTTNASANTHFAKRAWREFAFTDSNVASATNADMLDGLHASSFVDRRVISGAGTKSNREILQDYYSSLADSQAHAVRIEKGSHSMAFGYFLNNPALNPYGGWFVASYGTPKWVGVNNGVWVDETFAFLSSNVASASKLQTARTIWGQSFDGSGNVSGDMSGVGYIKMSSYLFMNSGAVAKGVYLRADDAGGLRICSHNNYVWTATNFAFTYDGKMGIGTTEPAYPLDVNGTARIRQRLYVPAGLDLGGPVVNYDGINLNIDQDAYSDMIYIGSEVKVLTASGELIVQSLRIGNVTISWDATKGALKINGSAYATGELTAKE